MGMSLAARIGRRQTRRGYRKRANVMAEINVTPMVDVMLVLLIIFMVSAPLLTVGVPLDLPQTRGQERWTSRQGAADGFGPTHRQGVSQQHRDTR
jgi:ABC-type Fe3+ transport system permease subunit